jgi:hypothetical protein
MLFTGDDGLAGSGTCRNDSGRVSMTWFPLASAEAFCELSVSRQGAYGRAAIVLDKPPCSFGPARLGHQS